MTKQATIGTVSSRTHRVEDLLSAFAYKLRYLVGKEAASAHPYLKGLEEAEAILESIEENSDWELDPENGEVATQCLEWFYETLGELAPPYCYFGAHPGDGSDFGFWPDFDAIECEGLPRVEDASELPDGYVGEWLLINDHGNCTLFTRVTAPEDVEGWSCV
jgi:hypothetical protein